MELPALLKSGPGQLSEGEEGQKKANLNGSSHESDESSTSEQSNRSTTSNRLQSGSSLPAESRQPNLAAFSRRKPSKYVLGSLLVSSLVAIGLLSKESEPQYVPLKNYDVHIEVLPDVIHRLPRLFMGHGIDASIIVKKEWQELNFDDEILTRAMELLPPSYIRFGGTLSDHTIFVEKKPDNFSDDDRKKLFNRVWRKSDPKNVPTDQFEIYGEDIDKLLYFVKKTRSRLLFCLNSRLFQKGKRMWNATNMMQLVDYIISKNFTGVDFSIGNEPHDYSNITGAMVGKAVKRLRKRLDRTILKDSLIVAPDMSRLYSNTTRWFLNFLRDTIRFADGSLAGGSFHQYYLPKNETYYTLLQPETRDSLGDKILQYQNLVKETSKPDLPAWITETGSMFGGGGAGISRSFASALLYADKLGVAASMRVSLVARQSLFGGQYRLFNVSDYYREIPDYWMAYLFGSLNGRLVRKVQVEPELVGFRCYAFSNVRGVTVMMINFNMLTEFTIHIKNEVLRNCTRHDYQVIAVGDDPRTATELMINNRLMKLPQHAEEKFSKPQGWTYAGGAYLPLRRMSVVFAHFDTNKPWSPNP